ncbi:rhodanese-like domain-containing protein [Neptunomonas phycophila]|jgi:rhodanese-related sulfurtransferase|uniref:Rhodanese-like domain-containing protein n=1 Tax=Neptunomonas phycophila TaxID=1572645 RepID=A0AAW7XMF3_9GAMM|nr:MULTISPECIES: rhodanese-like domain-containing protein [Neptunomonas]MBT3147264.1 rhodanese-like domain-containing protein [Neptunomonas phycophila]MDN2659972.1 rhodanese-like domain-containing protein [Neptunomonas sp. CHC150]MDO6455305.1 rhodanese-like domain-containing protein [Neptunomonas phycophila]MDO6469872.1 rhodanese-like domain-containing protein [Neptunomonas phycophila]MDO6785817.1 rhodanese-like domain-containing protein [Neptunomonas phycophila]
MEQFIEFATNNLVLIAAWVATLALLLWTEGQKGGHAVSPAIATQMINKEDAVVVDIRTKKEWDTGHITGAKHIPLADLARRIEELNKYKTKPIIVVCNIGQTAGSASKQLKEAGFENVSRLQGGITEWKGQNLPIIKKGK